MPDYFNVDWHFEHVEPDIFCSGCVNVDAQIADASMLQAAAHLKVYVDEQTDECPVDVVSFTPHERVQPRATENKKTVLSGSRTRPWMFPIPHIILQEQMVEVVKGIPHDGSSQWMKDTEPWTLRLGDHEDGAHPSAGCGTHRREGPKHSPGAHLG